MNMTLKFGMMIRYEKFNSFLNFHNDSKASILIQNEIFYSDVKVFFLLLELLFIDYKIARIPDKNIAFLFMQFSFSLRSKTSLTPKRYLFRKTSV